MMYNYLESMKDDIREYLEEEQRMGYLDMAEWTNDDGTMNRDALEQKLNDDLWVCDSVTGNASGSYTFNTFTAEEYLAHNWDLLQEALQEFCCECNPIEKGAEWCDVTIRCYLLGSAISEVLDEMEEAMEADEA